MDHVDFDRLLVLDDRDRMDWLVDEIEWQFPCQHTQGALVDANHLRIVRMALAQLDRAGAVDNPRLRRLARDARARVEARCPWLTPSRQGRPPPRRDGRS